MLNKPVGAIGVIAVVIALLAHHTTPPAEPIAVATAQASPWYLIDANKGVCTKPLSMPQTPQEVIDGATSEGDEIKYKDFDGPNHEKIVAIEFADKGDEKGFLVIWVNSLDGCQSELDKLRKAGKLHGSG